MKSVADFVPNPSQTNPYPTNNGRADKENNSQLNGAWSESFSIGRQKIDLCQ